MTELQLSLDDIKAIPRERLPMLCFADSIYGFFSFGVRLRTKGSYSHFQWILPGGIASQDITFRMFPVKHFKDYRLKIVEGNWTKNQRHNILAAIVSDLDSPWWKRLYDWPGVIGELFNVNINIPFLCFCSERGSYLCYGDEGYNLKHPTPSELNAYCKGKQDLYSVYGRYEPD